MRRLAILGVAALAELAIVAHQASGLRSVVACVLVSAVPLALYRADQSSPPLSAAARSGAIGGLGMVVGRALDVSLGSAVPPCHAFASGRNLLTWANALMIASCLLADVVLLAPCQGPRWMRIAACTAGMTLGMIVGGMWLTGIFAAIVDAATASHCAMVIGMMLGSAAAHLQVGARHDVSPAPPR